MVAILSVAPSACAPVGGAGTEVAPAGIPFPALETAGAASRERAQEAGSLLNAARDSLAVGALARALDLAEGVMRDYPGAPGSAEALLIAARARMALDQPREAADAASRLAALLDRAHPALPLASLLAARGYRAVGADTDAMEALRGLPPVTPDSVLDPARDILREVIPNLPNRSLQMAAESFPPDNPLRGILAVEWASVLYLRGEDLEARRWAGEAMAGGLAPREQDMAQGIMDGRLEEVLGLPLILGAVLPRSGASPGLQQYGEWVYEGIQVAVETFRDSLPRPAELEVVDDRGSPLGGRTAFRSLQDFGALGLVGPLTQQVLEEVASARQDTVPIVSPFAYLLPEEAPAVYSLSGPDPGGARLVARAAWELGLRTVAVVRPQTQEARVNSEAFQEEYLGLGGIVPREIVYDSGGTFFQPQFREVEAILPDGLFLPLTPADIQLLAPQVTFYGLDTLGVQLLGTSGWTEPSVVQEVDSRHTDGVVAATTRLSQDETEAFQRFRNAYETYFQKTLRSQVPAYGYDAAALLLRGLQTAPRNALELREAMEGIRDLAGATGNLSVDRGWVTRQHFLVRIQDHELIYITRRFD